MEREFAVRGRTGAALVLIGLAALTACSSGTHGSSSGSSARPWSSSAPTGSPATSGWIAVFRVASDPSDLDDDTTRLAPILGAAVRTSPVQCFRGLPASAGRGYVLGAVARTKPEVRELVARAGLTPLFVARVDELCLD